MDGISFGRYSGKGMYGDYEHCRIDLFYLRTDRGNSMNGEMYQICCIVAAAKKALQDGADILYTPSEYIFRTEFCFLPEKELFIQKEFTAYNVEEWFEHCKQKKLQDIKFLAPVSVSDRKVLGFANASQSSMVCFYEGGKVTYFTARWGLIPRGSGPLCTPKTSGWILRQRNCILRIT